MKLTSKTSMDVSQVVNMTPLHVPPPTKFDHNAFKTLQAIAFVDTVKPRNRATRVEVIKDCDICLWT